MIRNVAGQFVSRQCPDPNCDGELRRDRDDAWRCDGLTHLSETGPLIACPVSLNPQYDRAAS